MWSMPNPEMGQPKTYSIVITRDDNTTLMIESGLSKERAGMKRMLICGAFRNVAVIETPPLVNPPATNPDATSESN